MAGCEKVCELSGEYGYSEMYRYKENLIQVMPKYRKLFKGADHELHIWKPEKKAVYRGGMAWTDAKKVCLDAHNLNEWSEDQWDKAWSESMVLNVTTRKFSNSGRELERFEFVFSSYKEMAHVYKKYCGLYLADYYIWDLVVKDIDLQGSVHGVYQNCGFNISTTKRKIKRLLGCRKLNIIKHDMTYLEWCELEEGV